MEEIDLKNFIIKDYVISNDNHQKKYAKVKLLIIDAPDGGNYLNLDGRWANPIIVSETENYKPGDNVYYHGKLIRNVGGLIKGIGVLKVLGLPEMFTRKQREAIYDGFLIHGEELWIECETYVPYERLKEDEIEAIIDNIPTYTAINLNKKNHIKLVKTIK
jgi:hypothetical protein